jgi:hypothetical protein
MTLTEANIIEQIISVAIAKYGTTFPRACKALLPSLVLVNSAQRMPNTTERMDYENLKYPGKD